MIDAEARNAVIALLGGDITIEKLRYEVELLASEVTLADAMPDLLGSLELLFAEYSRGHRSIEELHDLISRLNETWQPLVSTGSSLGTNSRTVETVITGDLAAAGT